uniref:CaMBD domain-containing protein n=1 Tax=Haemonchus placei TaxID=6290 RepID=A0A0N4VX50_HAEPC
LFLCVILLHHSSLTAVFHTHQPCRKSLSSQPALALIGHHHRQLELDGCLQWKASRSVEVAMTQRWKSEKMLLKLRRATCRLRAYRLKAIFNKVTTLVKKLLVQRVVPCVLMYAHA